ncbi:hypothetical protein GOP47_0003323 [Adiantum capillus-veneris]|uniref:Uncharacterized protein n=1 Tax=Adiantum capillus-veneris TaxID=13818 RepID=A0A9D4VBR5_ADICA|nr:hypothetical protein GOP47_0003323 [Adiantum capillus-veneris]
MSYPSSIHNIMCTTKIPTSTKVYICGILMAIAVFSRGSDVGANKNGGIPKGGFRVVTGVWNIGGILGGVDVGVGVATTGGVLGVGACDGDGNGEGTVVGVATATGGVLGGVLVVVGVATATGGVLVVVGVAITGGVLGVVGVATTGGRVLGVRACDGDENGEGVVKFEALGVCGKV